MLFSRSRSASTPPLERDEAPGDSAAGAPIGAHEPEVQEGGGRIALFVKLAPMLFAAALICGGFSYGMYRLAGVAQADIVTERTAAAELSSRVQRAATDLASASALLADGSPEAAGRATEVLASASATLAMPPVPSTQLDGTLSTIRASTLVFAGIPFALALLIGLALTWGLGRRLDRIARGVRAFQAGDLAYRIADPRQDAIGELARTLDVLAADLAHSTVSNAELDTMLESVADPFGVVGPEGRVLRVNRASADLFGIAREELVGMDVMTLFAGQAEVMMDFTMRVLDEGRVVGYETDFLRRDGTAVPVRLSAALMPKAPDGSPRGIVMMAQDVTPVRRAHAQLVAAKETAEAATRAKSEFLANMSHEIRTPLNGVIGMTGHLLDTPLSPEQQEYASIVRTSGESLLGIINDVLDFSKIEAGMLELDAHPFEVRASFEDAIDLVAYRAAEKGVELAYLHDDALPYKLMGDATRLRQVVVNLLANAVKFTDHGEVILRVDAADGPAARALTSGLQSTPGAPVEADLALHISVRDTGIGIAPDRLEALFEAFTQADTSTTRTYGGTGLGLAISRRLVDAMGGRIWAESTPGEGTTFHVVVPAEALDERRPAAACDTDHLAGRRLLVVDDTAANRRILEVQGAKWGMEVVALESAAEAIVAVASGATFDLAILDYQMPETDGAMLAVQLRALAPELPLVLLSSVHQTPAVPDGLLAAALHKPIKPAHLCHTVLAALDLDAPAAEPLTPIVRAERAVRIDPAWTAPAEGTRAAAPAPVAASPLRLLVAEDNAVNRRVVELTLSRLGHACELVPDGADAVEAVARAVADGRPYDAVFMDLRMPTMDGLEATARIRTAGDPQPRIIAMTADVTHEKREACFAAGMDSFLGKPLDPEALREVLGQLSEDALAAQPTGPPAAGPPATPEALPCDPALGPVLEAFPALLGQVDDDHELYHSLLVDAAESIDEELLALRGALQTEDMDTAARAAHTIKTMGALLEDAPLHDLAQAAQDACDAGGLGGAVDAFLELHARARAVCACVAAETGEAVCAEPRPEAPLTAVLGEASRA